MPKDILTDLPLSDSFSASDSIADHNSELRGYINQMLQCSWTHHPCWKELLDKKNKKTFRKIISEKPEIMNALIVSYKSTAPEPYDFEQDPKRKFRWNEAIREYARSCSLDTQLVREESCQQKANILCRSFCEAVKAKMHSEFYLPSNNLVPEKIGQLIFLEFINCNAPVNYDSKTGLITLYESDRVQNYQMLFLYRTKGLLQSYKKEVGRINKDSKVIGINIILLKAGSFLEEKSAVDKLQRVYQRKQQRVPTIFIADARRECFKGQMS